MNQIFAQLFYEMEKHRDTVLVTLIDAAGSAPRKSGSRAKTASVNRRLREAGIPEESIAQIHTPIGTAIQAVTPAEIAVSIAGEMILCRAERRGDKPHGCPMH